MPHPKFSLKKRAHSFKYAWAGMVTLLREEHNARIHLFFALIALLLSWFLRISPTEWLFVLGAIALVFVTELLNSAIEKLADFVSPEKHSLIKKVKDFGAAAVLIAALNAFIIGLVIFLPKLISCFAT